MLPAAAQKSDKWTGIGFEADYYHSNMMRHSKKITAPLAQNTTTFDLNFVRKYYGKKDWEIRRHYPEVGLGIIYLNYNNPNLYGQVFGIFPNIRLRLLTLDRFSWTARVGMGICYVTKPYERVPKPNLENETIGGYANNISPLQTDLKWKINEHWEIQGGAHLIHVSNASFRKPNFGINIWGLQAGVRYFPISNTPARIRREVPKLSNRIVVYAKGSIAFIEKYVPDGGLNRVYNAGIFATKRYLGKNKAILGMDYTYNTAAYAFMKFNERHAGEENKYAYQASVFIGNEFTFSRVGIVLQGGVYLKTLDQQTDKFYQKLGANYYIWQKERGILKEIVLSALLKTHQNNAELFELGLSVGF
ncbi:hypothetical protein DBR32_00220 [Taibaiella sp. KBW10]|uniref:acyloxyacyl hydrolase n=1 Tax=Taibaiella sp. KBW10 TaxID=2153357 RepID=UPI000F591AA7|nr:acyloxyacyl hydrolase [Taibaiella sp. KBW10]RQO32077.1 hypothetical protein DBR32_00220 [Taibaiella sp. KBW10]